MANGLTITTLSRHEDGGTGDRWVACWGDDYDGSGATVEEALADLAVNLGNSIDKKRLLGG